MSETVLIAVPRVRDLDGQPTCSYGEQRCPFLTYGNDAVEVCLWSNKRLINLREQLRGSTIPHANCPVWNGEVLS